MTFALATIRHQGTATPVLEHAGQYWSLAALDPTFVQGDPARCVFNLFQN